MLSILFPEFLVLICIEKLIDNSNIFAWVQFDRLDLLLRLKYVNCLLARGYIFVDIYFNWLLYFQYYFEAS